jgi:hypothetical protein
VVGALAGAEGGEVVPKNIYGTYSNRSPSYTRRHYIDTARIIHESGAKGKVLAHLTQAFAELFGDDNPSFSFRRWDDACKEGKVRVRESAKQQTALEPRERPEAVVHADAHRATCLACKTRKEACRHLQDDPLTYEARLAVAFGKERAA